MSPPFLTPMQEKYLDGTPKLLRHYFETWINDLERRVGALSSADSQKPISYSQITNEDGAHTLEEDISTIFGAFETQREELNQLRSDLAEACKNTATALAQSSPSTKQSKEVKELKDAITALQQERAAMQNTINMLVVEVRTLYSNVPALTSSSAPTGTIDDSTLKALTTWATETGARIGMPFKK